MITSARDWRFITEARLSQYRPTTPIKKPAWVMSSDFEPEPTYFGRLPLIECTIEAFLRGDNRHCVIQRRNLIGHDFRHELEKVAVATTLVLSVEPSSMMMISNS